jgi:hypothetical protein
MTTEWGGSVEISEESDARVGHAHEVFIFVIAWRGGKTKRGAAALADDAPLAGGEVV